MINFYEHPIDCSFPADHMSLKLFWFDQIIKRPRPGLSILLLKKLVFAETSNLLRIPMEHTESICSLEFDLTFDSMGFVGILDILEVFENQKMLIAGQD